MGVFENEQMYFVRTDHIGRPVFATDVAGVKVWEASYLPIGGVHTTIGTPINLRFPGQWFQSETGLHQNWMRDYDPTTGRYIQADPLGLVDGASVYGYALQNPGRYMDPTGEFVFPAAIWVTRLGITGYRAYQVTRAARAAQIVALAVVAGSITSTQTGTITEEDENCDENCTPANAVFWNSLENHRGIYRKLGQGKNQLIYKWDYGHYCELEVFDRRGKHLGAVDANTGIRIPGKKGAAKPGRVERGLR